MDSVTLHDLMFNNSVHVIIRATTSKPSFKFTRTIEIDWKFAEHGKYQNNLH